MEEERMQILKMIQEGTISAEEGAKLLETLDTGEPVKSGKKARWLKIRVTDLKTNKVKVNVNIPMGILNATLRMADWVSSLSINKKEDRADIPSFRDIDLSQLVAQAMQEGTMGKLVDVIDEEEGEKVEIWVE